MSDTKPMSRGSLISPPEQELRLAALDRAINRLQGDCHKAGPDDVVAVAAKFEQYLRG